MDQPNPDSALDKWLSDQYEVLRRDVTAKLDLEAGFQEALLKGSYEFLAEDVRRSLDLEAGLAAVLSDSMNPDEDSGAFSWSHGNSVQIVGRSPGDRLEFRTHTTTPPPGGCECVRVRSVIFEFLKLGADTLRRLVQEEDVTAGNVITAVENINSAVTYSLNEFNRPFVADLGNLRDLAVSLTSIRDLDTAYPAIGRASRKFAERLDELDKFCNDFTEADLSRTSIGGLWLVGVRWSKRTKWPSDWVERIRKNSAPLPSEPGVFVILHELPQVPEQDD